MICEKSFVAFKSFEALNKNMADNRSLGGHSQLSNGSFRRIHSVRSSIRSSQTVSAQELFYEGQNPDQVSIGTITPEGSDDRIGRGGLPETVVMPAINPDTNFTLSTGIKCRSTLIVGFWSI